MISAAINVSDIRDSPPIESGRLLCIVCPGLSYLNSNSSLAEVFLKTGIDVG